VVTPADHANTVRDALSSRPNRRSPDPALAALDALLAQADDASALLKEASQQHDRALSAEAERDAAVRAAEQAHAALREIERFANNNASSGHIGFLARAALSAREEAWTHEDRMVLGEGGC
jgi:hypothetical protein